jgi:type I restriction enzyme S subunit
MVNMGELFAYPRLRNAPMDRVPLSRSEGHKFLLQEGDLLFARQSLVLEGAGKCSIFLKDNDPVTFESHVTRVRLDPGKADPNFYFYYLQSPHGAAAIRSIVEQGAGASGIRGSDLQTLAVQWRPLPEQRAIAHILGTLDDKIELNRRMNETLEAMARALFKSWFIDFDPVRAKAEGRDPDLPKPLADLFPDSFEDSELGEIPKGWAVEALGGLIDTVKGRSYKSEELVESDTALVTLKSFARGGGYRTDGLKSFAGTYKPEQVVQPGEVVIACTDVTQAAEVIGRPAIVRGTGVYRRLVASLDTLIVRPRDSSMTRSFLYFLGGTEAFVAHTYAHTTGTTVLHLAKEAVPSFTFARPSTQLVKEFDALAGPALDRIQALDEESGTLAALRDTLLPRLISGQLRVHRAQELLAEAQR